MRAQASRSRVLCAAAVLLLPAASASAQFTEPPPPAAYALRNVTLVAPDGARSAGVTLVVRGEFIEALGPGVAVPADARLLDGDSLFVYPGLVDAHGTVEHAIPPDSIDRRAVKSWNPTREAQGFRPHRRIADFVTATGRDAAALRRKGVVAVGLHPTEGLMPGQGALLLLRADAASSTGLILDPALGPVFTLRGGRGFYPSTVMGAIAFFRQTFLDAHRHNRIAQAAQSDARAGLPAFDRDYAAVSQVVGGGTPVWFIASTSDQIRQALRLAAELDFRPIIVGGAEAWKVADELAAADVPVLVSLEFTEPRRWKPETKDSSSTEAAVLHERRALEDEYRNTGRLAAAGVRFALTSNGGKAELIEQTRTAIRYGLDEAAALRALTATPATLLGAPALARVQAGMPANFVVTSGPLFDEGTRVRYTFVAGALEEGAAAGARRSTAADSAGMAQVAGTWTVEVQSPQGAQPSTLTLTQDGTAISGTMDSELGSAPVSGTVEGGTIEFSVTINIGGQSMTIEFSGDVDGDSASGTATMPMMGNTTWTARRTAPGTEDAQ